eukprot:72148-Rhodomonas_salina.1
MAKYASGASHSVRSSDWNPNLGRNPVKMSTQLRNRKRRMHPCAGKAGSSRTYVHSCRKVTDLRARNHPSHVGNRTSLKC